MGRGLGTTQTAILQALPDDGFATVPELATEVGRSQRQVRAAVHALAARELVVTEHDHTDWRGIGEYGRLVPSWPYGEDVPRVTVHKGEPWPNSKRLVAARDVEFVHQGMPVYGIQVWSPEAWQRYQERREAFRQRIRAL